MELKPDNELVEMSANKMYAYFEDVAKQMATYEQVVAQNNFIKRDNFMARYSGLGGASMWKNEYTQAQPKHGTLTERMSMGDLEPLDLEKAKPFVRAVVERMLDLLASEENWIKHAAAADGNGQTVNPESEEAIAWCLIGAQARALHDLSLATLSTDSEVEKARRRVIKAVDAFLKVAMQRKNGVTALPVFNDRDSTDFEDVRLWLKGMLSELS